MQRVSDEGRNKESVFCNILWQCKDLHDIYQKLSVRGTFWTSINTLIFLIYPGILKGPKIKAYSCDLCGNTLTHLRVQTAEMRVRSCLNMAFIFGLRVLIVLQMTN